MWSMVKRALKTLTSGSLWIVVLTPVLGVSAYSLFYVARHMGVPWPFACSMSTCFDGAMLWAANYSVRYAQEGLSGSGPRTFLRILCAVSAYIQSLHARIGHELPGSWLLWAALPVIAATVYEIHIRWERRKALAKTGAAYPTPLPAFGFMTWVLFPFSTLVVMREIVQRRRLALVSVANEYADQLDRERTKGRRPIVSRANETPENPVPSAVNEKVVPITSAPGGRHAPTRHIRHWAQRPEICREYGWKKPGERARLPQRMIEAYHAAHQPQAQEEAAAEAGGAGP